MLICDDVLSMFSHYRTKDTHALRSWRLDASLDAIHWTTISTHINDTSLRCRNATATWVIPPTTQGYSIFRIVIMGVNSSEHYCNLCCAGFEM